MSKDNGSENGTNMNPLHEIMVARHPIFDRKKEVFAYELLFKPNLKEHMEDISSKKKSKKVSVKGMDSILTTGLMRLTSGKRAVINFNRDMILGKLPMIFPSDMLGVELLDNADTDKKMAQSVKKLKDKGYLLIVNDDVFNQGELALVKMADIVGVDFRSPGLQKRFSIFEDDPARPRFMAKSVETAVDFDVAMDKGYQYFQGDFFNSVDLVSVRSIPGYKMNLMRILKEINKPYVEFERIEEILKKDISITYKLLRFINSSNFGFKTTVQSIHHALTLLGEVEVRKWLSLIVLSSVGTDKPQELVQSALVRAKFCEGLALELKKETPNFFLTGMFSMVDSFLGRPMQEVLTDLPLDKDVKNALTGTQNIYRDVLDVVTDYEKGDWRSYEKSINNFKIDTPTISSLYFDAIQWGKLL
jgi:EAL and modified HD-GYP domain-containing signal transduction protein